METFINNLVEGINSQGLIIQSNHKLVELPNWDSLAILTTLSMLDMEYGVTLSGTELQNCGTVAELYGIVEQRKK